MKELAFSVAMSVYKNDNPEHFDRALKSITEEQTIKPNEIVLVVDGPVASEIDKVIEKYSNLVNMKVVRFEKNQGLGKALQKAVENCSCDYIARMDSDDVAVCNRFEQQIQVFNKNPQLDICGGNISEFVDDESHIIGYRNLPILDVDIKKYSQKRCPFNHPTVMFKKASVTKVGGYEDYYHNEDYYLWVRMILNNCIFANTGTVLVNMRTSMDQMSRRGGLKYFNSEIMLQKYMLENGIINKWVYFTNIAKRFVVQVLATKGIRRLIYKKFARSK